ncbi:MAG TPA: urease accessory UreF family protein [Vicinamibacterales bacterium]|nr:urease accessory UreF family protein [Vicinamibacterales bacterium]
MNLVVLHLCDSLFPIGAFAYSDGLEAAFTVRLKPDTTNASSTNASTVPLKPDTTNASAVRLTPDTTAEPIVRFDEWLDVVLDESIGRLDGPAVWRAWIATIESDWPALIALDEELTAIRPAAAARSASRGMGRRLLTTWRALHPDARLSHVPPSCSLPIAFAAACACAGVARRESVAAYAYTRLASTVSAAMRVLPLGQTDAHVRLARALDRVPAVVDAIEARDGPIESFSPAFDIAAMTQQYLHSRLFRS